MATGFQHRFKGKVLLPKTTQTVFGNGATEFTEGGQLYNYLSATGTGNGNDTTEDLLQSFTLPANCFDAVARGLQILAWGTFANNTHAKTAKLYFGTSVTNAQSSSAGGGVLPWLIELDIWKSGANAQIGFVQPIISTTHGGVVLVTGSETDTAAITIKVTGQTGTAAASDVVLLGLSIFAMN